MKTRITAVVTGIVLSSFSAHAENPPQLTGGQFVARCSFDRTWCSNTVVQAQMIDALMLGLQGKAAQRRYCVPKTMSGSERAQKIVKWMSRRPDVMEEPASFAMLKAEKTLWPCGLFN